MAGLDTILALIGTLGGMLIPPIFDFIKKKFLPPGAETPEATLSSLSLTKPDILPAYVSALATYYEAQTKYFNRDVVGTPSLWVVNLRAAIRPVAVVLSFIIIGLDLVKQLNLDPATRTGLLVLIGNWLGSRLVKNGG